MRLLLIHADELRYWVTKKAIKEAEELEKKEDRFEDCLIVFWASEKSDEENLDAIAKNAANEIENIARQINAKRIILYPYVHLLFGTEPATKAKAIELKDKILDLLKEKGFEVGKAPFGYYKEFELKCKGHPLSELSRVIRGKEVGEEISKALKEEEKLKSYWYILDLEGNLIPVEEFDFSNFKNLKKFADYEIAKARAVEKEPIHVKLMRKLELADYEPGSDPGNLRWYPKGRLIKSLLEEYVGMLALKFNAMEVESPVMYDFEHPNLAEYLHRFPARQYIVISGNKKYFLRFAACFGQYLIMRDMITSYKQLPVRLYELTRYSFRREQKGELVGLRRLRAFTMPDMHTLVKDMEQAKEEFLEQFKLCLKWMKDLGLEFEIAIRFWREFYEENREFAKKLVNLAGKPALIEIWDKRPFYFVMKFEFNVIDTLDKASALSTVQIDVENSERFGLGYYDEEGKRRPGLLLHASISGAIERNIYAILEQEWMKKEEKGKMPVFPLWLSPTQVRLIPVSERFNECALRLSEELGKEGIRADVDDRNESVSKKIFLAEEEWIPYIVVIGEREMEGKKWKVRIREENGKIVEMGKEELIRMIKEKTKGFPFKPLPLPKLLSKRPKFGK